MHDGFYLHVALYYESFSRSFENHSSCRFVSGSGSSVFDRRVGWGRLAFALRHFLIQLANFFFDLAKFCPAAGCDFVDAADLSADDLAAGAEVALLFHAVEGGVEGSGADAVAVTAEFLDHAEAEEGALGGVVEHVEPDEA
jgi:hypothetical protein